MQYHSYIINDDRGFANALQWRFWQPGSHPRSMRILVLVSGSTVSGYGVAIQRVVACECHGAFCVLTVVDKRNYFLFTMS